MTQNYLTGGKGAGDPFEQWSVTEDGHEYGNAAVRRLSENRVVFAGSEPLEFQARQSRGDAQGTRVLGVAGKSDD